MKLLVRYEYLLLAEVKKRGTSPGIKLVTYLIFGTQPRASSTGSAIYQHLRLYCKIMYFYAVHAAYADILLSCMTERTTSSHPLQ